MNKIQKSHKFMFMIIVITTFTIILAIFGTALYITMRNILETQLGVNARGVAVATSLIIMENVEEYESLLETRNADSDYYRKMQDYFSRIKANSNIKYIFTERRLDSETIEYILDSEPIGSPDYSPVGSIGPNDWKREIVYSTMLPEKFKLYDHPVWGKIIPAYAPIFAKDGEFLGILGINFDSTELFDKLDYLFTIMILTYVVLLGVIVFLLIAFSDVILEPMLKDKLTGAYNKRYFEKFLRSEMKAVGKNNHSVTILMLDLDHFKRVNDAYGHVFGDKVLQAVAKIIKDALRKDDYLVRYGGEEFLVVLANVKAIVGFEIAERIRKTIEISSIYNEEAKEHVKITISIGVAQMKNTNLDVGELIDNADKALYAAKKDRNKVCVFE